MSATDRFRASCRATCITLVCMLFSVAATAASNMTFFNVYGDEEETAQALDGINHIVQDDQGFLWFGGESGLGRYDGQNTKIYRHSANDPHSLPHNHIRGLVMDRIGVMWVATDAGLCAYHARFDRFDCHPRFADREIPRQSITALWVDPQNHLYVGSSTGFFRIAADRLQLREYSLPPAPDFLNNQVMDITEDAAGVLWLGTADAGLVRLDPDTGMTRSFRSIPGDPTSVSHNKLRALTFDATGQLWIATYGGGISIFDPQTEHFRNFAEQTGKPGSVLSRVMWDVFRDSQGIMWLASDQQGLLRYDPAEGFIAQRHRPYDRTSLPSNQIRAIYEDRNGDLWIGSFPSGVSFYNRATGKVKTFTHQPDQPRSLSHSSILAIHQDSRANIWIGTEDGLNLLNPQKEEFTRYQYGPNTQLTAKAILSIAQFDESTLWIGTWSGGLLAFDLNTRQFTPIDTRPEGSAQQNSLFIWDIIRDSRGDMWIATEFEGVGHYDRASGKFRFFQHKEDDQNSLAGNFCRDLLEDRHHNIWVATNAGLNLWVRAEDKLLRVAGRDKRQLTSHRLVSLMEDSEGDIWIGSKDKGVFIHTEEKGVRHLGSEHGLPSLTVSGAIEDRDKNIWLLTTNGLARLEKADLVPQVFSTESGLAGRSFNRRAALLTPTGELYVGGADGLNIFNPADIKVESPSFEVWLTDLRLLNRSVSIRSLNSPLSVALPFTDEIHLTHRDLMFSLEFAALNYRMRQHTRYSYRLVGFDMDWHEIGRHNSATYTNLPAGNYTFQVRALGGDKQWVHSRDLHIHVAAAPWLTPWAIAFYAGTMVLLGYLLAHYWKLRLSSRVYRVLSTTDPLTGLHNRLALKEAAAGLFIENRRHSVCVLFVDIDHFKRINDRRGHDSGDRVLQEAAIVFQSCVRQTDLLARWGGEEFVLLCQGVDQHGGATLAEKIRHQIANHVFDERHAPLKVTVSIGVAVAAENETFDSTCKRADEALYTAKNQGRNCVVLSSEQKKGSQ